LWKEIKEKKVRGPSKPKPRTRDHLLSEDDIKKVIKVIKNFYEKFVFYGILYTGLRKSEFIHMRKTWIDFKRNLIRVPDKQKCDCGQCKLNRKKLADEDYDSLNTHKKLIYDGYWVPKTEMSARTIPILDEARGVLYPFFKKHKAVIEVYPWTQYTNNVLNRLQRRSKIKIFPHCLRGSLATMLAIRDFDAYRITEIMGWADINVAIFYIKLSGAVLTKEVNEKWSPKK